MSDPVGGMVTRDLTPQAPAGDPDHDIGFGAEADAQSCGIPMVWGNLVASYGMIGGLLASYFVMRAVGTYLSLPRWTPLAAVGIGSLLMIFPMLAITRRLRVKKASTAGVPARCAAEFRVRVIANAEQAKRVREQEPMLRRDGFEVEIARPWFGRLPSGATHAVLWPAAGVAMAAMWLADSLTPGRGMFMSLLSLQMFAAFAIGALVAELAWPVYLRVSPGRLDEMRYGFLGLGKARIRTFDLRTSRVMVNLRARAVVIEPADGLERLAAIRAGRKPTKQGIAAEKIGGLGVALTLTRGADEFLGKVIQGAITGARGEELPRESWTG